PPTRLRIGRLVAVVVGLAAVSVAIAIAVRGAPQATTASAAALAPSDAGAAVAPTPLAPADSAAITATPDDHAAVTAPPPAPHAGANAPADGRTSPPGARVPVHQCRTETGTCVAAAPADAPIFDCPASPCAFPLRVDSYEIVVELGGTRQVRTVELAADLAT